MDILKSFSLLNKEYKINIIGTSDEPLFQASHIANILEMKRINDSISNFDDDEKVLKFTNTPGGIQQAIFLTEFGLYKLLLKSRKPIAKPFQKWVYNIIKELRINKFYKLNEDNEIEKKLIQSNMEIEKHKLLIEKIGMKNNVYICKFKEEQNKILIKIGNSSDVKTRLSNLTQQYNNLNIKPILLDLIEINKYIQFENYLHKHKYISNFSHRIEDKDGQLSTETYLVDNESLTKIIKIINSDKIKYEEICVQYMDKMIEREDLQIKKKELEINKLSELKEIKQIDLQISENENKYNELKDKIDNLQEIINTQDFTKKLHKKNNLISIVENNEKRYIYDKEYNSESEDEDDIDLTTIYFNSKKQSYSTKMPRVYQYDPNNLAKPIKIYESPSDVERDPDLKHLEISPTPLRNASKNNTIYKGFRWLFVNRNDDSPEIIHETIENKHKEPEIKYVAMINITQTKILEVFPNQKEAAKARLMKTNSFHRAIKNGSISSGHYWNYFENCSQEMQDEFLQNNTLPDKYISPCGKRVEQICPITKKVLKKYDSNREVIKQFKMSVTSLKKYSESGEIHNGYIWKIC